MRLKGHEERKMHFGTGGRLMKCVAENGNCPFFATSAHGTFDELQGTAEHLEAQLAKQNEAFMFAVSDKTTVGTALTDLAITRTFNMERTLEKLNKIKYANRQRVLDFMRSKGIKTVKSDAGTFTAVDGGKRRSVSPEKMSELGESVSDYMRNSEARRNLSLEIDNNAKDKADLERLSTAFSAIDLDKPINMKVNDKGKVEMDVRTVMALRQMRDFEAAVQKAEEQYKEVKKNLMKAMRTAGVEDRRIGKIHLHYQKSFVRQVPDTKKLKEDGLYDSVVEEVRGNPSLRARFAKVA